MIETPTTDPAFNEAYAFLDTVLMELGSMTRGRGIQYLRTELLIPEHQAAAVYDSWREYEETFG